MIEKLSFQYSLWISNSVEFFIRQFNYEALLLHSPLYSQGEEDDEDARWPMADVTLGHYTNCLNAATSI